MDAPEFNYVPFVVNLYQFVFGVEEPSAADLSSWVTYLVSTGDVSGMLTALLTAPEFVTKPRSLDNHVKDLSLAARGLWPLPEVIASYVAVLRSRLSPVVDVVIGSPDFAARLQAMLSSVPASTSETAPPTRRVSARRP